MYTKHKNEYTKTYKKEHYKTFRFELKKEYYEDKFLPAVQETGETASGFIRKAVEARIDQHDQCPFGWERMYYDNVVVPVAKEKGMDANTFIKKCVAYAIENDIQV